MGEPIHKKYPDVMSGISDRYDIVSMNHVLSSGRADIYSSLEQTGTQVDLTTKSEGKKAIDGMIAKAIQRIEESQGMQALLNKPVWNLLDRQQWEQSISDISRDLIAEEPRFGKYRINQTKPKNTPLTEITQDTNFHCEPMAILTGVLIQNMENKILPESSPEDSFKRRQSYYLGGGMLNRSPANSGTKPKEYFENANSGALLHGYLVSPMTGNVIEGTQGRPQGWSGGAESTYQHTPKGYTFAHYISGFPIATSSDIDYTYGYNGDEKAKSLAQSRMDAVSRGDFGFLESHRAKDSDLGSQYDFLNTRNFLRANRVEGNNYYRLEGADAIAYANTKATENVKGEGRSYEQLIKDSNNPDFSMTEIELQRAKIGNVAMVWAGNNPNEVRLVEGKGNERLRAQPWQDQKLADYLISQGVEDVWLFKPLPKGQSFVDYTRALFDQLPPDKKTHKNKAGKDAPILFEDYLALSRERLKLEDDFQGNENAPETMVPVLMNPDRAVKELHQRPGRAHNNYWADDVPQYSMTSVAIYDQPGTKKDAIQFMGEAASNGNYVSFVSSYESITLGTTIKPSPTPPKPKGTDTSVPLPPR